MKGQKHKSLNFWKTKSTLIQFLVSLTDFLGRQQSIGTYGYLHYSVFYLHLEAWKSRKMHIKWI